MKKRKWLITALGIGLICGMLLNGCAGKKEESQSSDTKQENMSKPVSEQAEPQSSVEQEQSPQQTDSEQEGLKSFTATALDGSTISQEEIGDKDVTILHFWATTCGPCIVEMPELAEFANALPENVQLITVCLDGLFDMEGAKSIVDEAGFQGITLITGEGDFRKVCERVVYTPTTITVNQEGNIVGDPIIGGQQDLAKTYTDAVNVVLQSMGKAEIGNENSENEAQ